MVKLAIGWRLDRFSWNLDDNNHEIIFDGKWKNENGKSIHAHVELEHNFINFLLENFSTVSQFMRLISSMFCLVFARDREPSERTS